MAFANRLFDAETIVTGQIERTARAGFEAQHDRLRHVIFVDALQEGVRIGQSDAAGLPQKTLEEGQGMGPEDDVRPQSYALRKVLFESALEFDLVPGIKETRKRIERRLFVKMLAAAIDRCAGDMDEPLDSAFRSGAEDPFTGDDIGLMHAVRRHLAAQHYESEVNQRRVAGQQRLQSRTSYVESDRLLGLRIEH